MSKGESAAIKEYKKSLPKRKKGFGRKRNILLAMIIVVGIVFLPTSMILFIGMMPTMSAVILGTVRTKTRVSTIAALNLVGCMPFIIKLWAGENNFEASFTILMTPLTIVIIYGAAASAYLLDWAVTGVVSAYMYQKAERRIKAIDKRLAAVSEVWGAEAVEVRKYSKTEAVE